MGYRQLILAGWLVILACSQTVQAGENENVFVGSQVCRDCHQTQYENFMKYSKKADSFTSIKKMEKKLTPEEYRGCFECHTTGFGKKGGFISEQQTPELKDTGCEVCHGPGSLHSESEDPDDIIRKMGMETCVACHNEERVRAFDFKPMMYGGAH